MISAGRLRYRVLIEDYSKENNTWSEFAQAWCAIRTIDASQIVAEDGALQPATTYSVFMRKQSNKKLTTRMRIKWNDRYLYINGITEDDDTHNTMLTISCDEVER